MNCFKDLGCKTGGTTGIFTSIFAQKFSLLIVTMNLLLCGCQQDRIPSGRILVKNDSMDSSYNVLQISAQGRYYSIKPGERVLLPKGSTNITFKRAYKDFTRHYDVRCPSNPEKGISIKLIDVHMNRIAGGCETTSAEVN